MKIRYPSSLHDCTLCPHECHADRLNGNYGWCKTGAGFSISSICIHRGEEPAISGPRGICNIFFTNCNLQCIYCQNHQISCNTTDHLADEMTLDSIVQQITQILDSGIGLVGFVSPSHNIPQILAIIEEVNRAGYHPRWVYNTNGYDKEETLAQLEGIIDIYLPDLKYLDRELGLELSGVPDYPEVATRALKEMFRQKGSVLHTNNEGVAESGIIIRHLVLPGHVENSLEALRFIAGELSPKIHVSLMSQYYPAHKALHHPDLSRMLVKMEYDRVAKGMEDLGLHHGWSQDFESSWHYRPDFNRDHPFEL